MFFYVWCAVTIYSNNKTCIGLKADGFFLSTLF